MARQFLAALALAYSATALMESFVDVFVKVDVQVTPDVFAGLLTAKGKRDEGSDACVIATEVLSSCDDAGAFATTSQTNNAVMCACCLGTTAISPAYSMCASSIADEAPNATRAISALSTFYNICSVERPCTGASAATATSTWTSPTQSSTLTAVTATPAACISMNVIYNSCSTKLAVTASTFLPNDAASCFCHDESAAWNTAFEDYAKACEPFYKTNNPKVHSIITPFTTICDAHMSGTNTNPSSPLPASPSTTSSSVGNRASRPGFLLWAANLVTFLLPFFALV